ncbi:MULTISPECIES: Flp family type IVb pilin [Bacillaceae]|uniref:Flp family type IVb pilin n=1 Tax=Evansella alkalicola TaxID=745819 RepID=A0ABS6JRW7_9BACI|nr:MULTISPECIES: Flp family type IVb pilin [Bacillaceae]MBU9721313.1 Flp family type IVb pilin [Bacillus alkalicola]
MKQFKKFMNEETGQGMTEYGLILGVIAIGAVAAFTAFGGALIDKINEVKDSVFSSN